MKNTFRRICSVFAGLFSLVSGTLWYLSSNVQLSILHTQTSGGSESNIYKLATLAAVENKLAAGFAALVGIALSIALFLGVND